MIQEKIGCQYLRRRKEIDVLGTKKFDATKAGTIAGALFFIVVMLNNLGAPHWGNSWKPSYHMPYTVLYSLSWLVAPYTMFMMALRHRIKFGNFSTFKWGRNLFVLAACSLVWSSIFVIDYKLSTGKVENFSDKELYVYNGGCKGGHVHDDGRTLCFSRPTFGSSIIFSQPVYLEYSKVMRDVPRNEWGILRTKHADNAFLPLGGYYQYLFVH